MPSSSPGTVEPYTQLQPGAPNAGLQSLAAFTFREKRYVAYISGSQLIVLSGPTTLVQAVAFPDEGGDLVALAVEDAGDEGRVCVACGSDVWLLQPLVESWTKVSWKKTLLLQPQPNDSSYSKVCTLSWGNGGEILIGSTNSLSLFSTLPSSRHSSPTTSPKDAPRAELESRTPLWTKPTASPVAFANFSLTASLIATAGPYDRLVKIWRRLSYEEALFDYAYLPHPCKVTHVAWRPLDEHAEERRGSGVSGRHDDDPEVLVTFAADGVLRLWRTGGLHDEGVMLEHANMDLVAAIPHSPTLTTGFQQQYKGGVARRPRYAFVLPAGEFSKAVTGAIGLQAHQSSTLSHSLEHLKDVSTQSPDVIVTLDGHGRMSAWGLQSIGHKRRPETPGSREAFHIAHCEDLGLMIPSETHARFEAWFEQDVLNVLVHTFEGSVGWWTGRLETFFSPSAPGGERLMCKARWTGLRSRVVGLRSFRERGLLVAWTANGEVTVWSLEAESSAMAKQCSFNVASLPMDAVLLEAHEALLLATSNELSMWSMTGGRLSSFDRDNESPQSLRLLHSATNPRETGQYHGAVLAVPGISRGYSIAKSGTELVPRATFDLPEIEGHGQSVHMEPIAHDAKQHILAVFKDGLVVRIEDQTHAHDEHSANGAMISDTAVRGAIKAQYPTGIANSSIFSANIYFAALASEKGRELCIIDLEEGYIEYRQPASEQIQHLSFFTSSTGHSMLALGYSRHVQLLAQGRYEPDVEQPVWLQVKKVSIQGLGLSIGALSWTAEGRLVVASGNGAFVVSDVVEKSSLPEQVTKAIDLPDQNSFSTRDLSERLTGSMPVWHPSLLSFLVMYCGNTGSAALVLDQLLRKLKFWSEGDELSPLLDMEIEEIMLPEKRGGVLEQSTLSGLLEQLSEKKLPAVSEAEQSRLQTVIKTLAYVSEHSNGLDANATRYLFTWQLLSLQKEPKQPPTSSPNDLSAPPRVDMPWRSILQAHNSSTQQPLLAHLLTAHASKLTWDLARSLGLPYWLSSPTALTQTFETLAQAAYRQQNPPDPVDATLYFLALNKKPTLLQLWRIATWHREQKSTMNFLKRDFANVSGARTAARKNAYALMGKRRFEYAGAFFLLAGDVDAAVGVLAGQCGDLGLAVGIARLWCEGEQGQGKGPGSGALRRLVHERLLPAARTRGDRWCICWCEGVLKRKREAIAALVAPLNEVGEVGMAREWRQDDPMTLMLYRDLGIVLPEFEYGAVLRGARMLLRMGLDLLALDLLSKWEFKAATGIAALETKSANEADVSVDAQAEPKEPAATNGTKITTNGSSEPKSILDDFSSTAPSTSERPPMLDSFSLQSSTPTAAAASKDDEKASREAAAAALMAKMKAKKEGQANGNGDEGKKIEGEGANRLPTQFKEPSANSLLDSFGF